ncbi:hypothetical protein A2U01_0095560, partial [Trifolium medium]|nr:hypothetical protein [Trifolium medium]
MNTATYIPAPAPGAQEGCAAH